MPRYSSGPVPVTISSAAPVNAPPAPANVLGDRQGNQIHLILDADGAAVTIPPKSAGGRLDLWAYDGRWRVFAEHFLPGGRTIEDGYGSVDLLRNVVNVEAIHVQIVNAVNLGNLSGAVRPIRGGQ